MSASISDWDLLDRFIATRDQAAFSELVQRHVHFVYHTARRSLGGPGAEADDVTQAVFLLLTQKAARVPRRGGGITTWLFTATRYCCANVRKAQARRRRREREAVMNRPVTTEESVPSQELAALLDTALEGLGAKERQAVLVRYLQQRSIGETAAALAISPEAVEKRVERGVGKLRSFFARKGYVVPAAAVAVLLAEEGAKAAPVALASSFTPVAGSWRWQKELRC